ncbi:MAG: 2-oxoacid:acceptor oxidoreductase family protein [Candidatus Omnitrophota bacterium]
MTTVNESIVCAGFGGQGIMIMGKILANAALERGLYVTWLPSYGAEVRGGTAHSMVRVSSDAIASPMVAVMDTAIIMNTPSLDKFEKRIKPGGLVIINSSMVQRKVKRSDIEVLEAALTEEAIKLGDARVANTIAVSIWSAKKGLFNEADILKVIEKMAGGKENILSANIKAVKLGFKL